MYRPFKSVSFSGLLCCLIASPMIMSGTYKQVAENNKSTLVIYTSPEIAGIRTADMLLMEEADKMYDSIRLKKYGLNRKAFEYAWKGFKYLQGKRRLDNRG